VNGDVCGDCHPRDGQPAIRADAKSCAPADLQGTLRPSLCICSPHASAAAQSSWEWLSVDEESVLKSALLRSLLSAYQDVDSTSTREHRARHVLRQPSDRVSPTAQRACSIGENRARSGRSGC